MAGKPTGKPTVQQRARATAEAVLKGRPDLGQRGGKHELARIVAEEMMEAEGWKNLEAAQSRVYDYLVRAKLASPKVEVLKQPDTEPIPADVTWDVAKKRNAQAIKKLGTRGKATLGIYEENWFGIGFCGDAHVDSPTADLQAIEDYAACVRETDGLYNAEGGDTRDNFILRVLMSAQLHAKHAPEEAMRMVEHYLSLFGGKTLWIVGGNHDAWEASTSGMDTLKALAKRGGILYDSDQFFIKLQCEGYTYKIFSRHKWRMNSTLNASHVNKQIVRMGLPEEMPDVVVTHHTHEGVVESWQHYGQERIMLKPGSPKRHDEYAHRLGYRDTGYMAPVILFNPKRRQMIPFQDYEVAAQVLTQLRRIKAGD